MEAVISGFEKEYEVAPVYQIPEFQLEDSKQNSINIKNLCVAVVPKSYSCQIILSFNVLEKVNYEYKSYSVHKDGKVKICEPRFLINANNDTYYFVPHKVASEEAAPKLKEKFGENVNISMPFIMTDGVTFIQELINK